MINSILLNTKTWQPKYKPSSDLSSEPLDCYEKQSENDAEGMKGDRARMASGRLHQKRGDTTVRELMKTYPEFCSFMVDATLDTIRNFYGCIGLNHLRKAIRERPVK